ncbi:MAG: hypothetical protein A2W19_11710 [Spirochaetes bacterium RBG_16_49_21]|nr:MAG: hypothetical protein A2W19_11710 [Spirochaetes bacterium RBG_16_49_21]
MNLLISKDKDGGCAYLTTDSPASHYGAPVLQISADDIDGDFGPSDFIDDGNGHIFSGAQIVAGWVSQPDRTPEEISAARKFLQQWPEGPQI